MYFKKLSLQGFKSFADPINIEFDKGITCIVGPNGSGKSNISDALRWVLGEQSPKMLRGGKMDEVIFAGTDKRRSKGMAEVELVIDNSDHSLPIDFGEVSITRRMYRSGESEYLINGSQCRLRDIRELIMDTGIGVDGYSIIGQGKISEIISGKPESRRAIFEEAAGIVKYRTKKSEAERKLESTSANLERVNDIINELADRVGPLKSAAERAEEYLKLSEKYRGNEINVILKNMEQAEKQTELLLRDRKRLEDQIAECDVKRRAADEGIIAGKQRLEELDARDMEARELMMKFNSELDELKNSIRVNNEKINALKASSRIYRNEKLHVAEKISHEEAELKTLRSRSEELTRKGERLTADLNELSSQYDSASAELKEHNEIFNSDRDQLYEMSMKSSAKGAEIEGLIQIRRTLEERLAAVSESSTELSADVTYEADYKNSLKKLEGLKHELELDKARLDGLKKEKSACTLQHNAALAEHSKVLASLNEAATRKNMLEQLENSYEGYNHAVKLVLNDHNLKGIYGTVGTLINVPPGYETAIDTALGARVQNIICHDDRSAGDAIRLLKVRRAGRLTFLPIESMRVASRRADSRLAGEEGFIGIAADCVDYSPKYEKAMEYLLGSIAVVKTLDDALRISKKYNGLRYVTLEGEFVNPAGAITGGSQKSSNAGILERKNRLNEAEKAVYQLEKDKKAADLRIQKAAENESQLSASIAETEARCRTFEIDIINLSNESEALKEKSQSYLEAAERSSRELERLHAELEKNALRISDLRKEKTDADASVDKLRQNAEILIAKNTEKEKKIDELALKLTDQKLKLQSVKNDISATDKLIKDCESRIKGFREEYTAKENAENESEAGQEQLVSRIAQSNDEIRIREAAFAGHNDNLEIIRQAKTKADADIEKLRTDRETIEKTSYGLRTAEYDIASRINSLKDKAEALRIRISDEFDITYQEAETYRSAVFDLSEGQKESRRLRLAIKSLGDVNIDSIEEYARVSERYEFLSSQKKDLDEATRSLKDIIEDTDVKIRAAFKSSFAAVNSKFKDIFAELFGGGRAELRIEGEDDPLEAAIDIVVQPPGKKLQNMNLLSGGEKTMTAIALMFAVLKTKPTPFCILDEVEAALDEANIERFAKYLENFDGIQFVLVTHQKVTMEHANVLYGVTMPEKGISKILSLKLSDAAEWEEKL